VVAFFILGGALLAAVDVEAGQREARQYEEASTSEQPPRAEPGLS
jgi:hypothetical protein